MIELRLKFLILILVFPFSWSLLGQELSVRAKLDTNIMLIGDQVEFQLELTKPAGLKVEFPNLKDTIMENIEIVEEFPVDTVSSTALQTVLRKNYILTSFDSTLYTLPSIPFAFQIDTINDTIWSNPLMLGVQTIKVDTTQMAIYDVKDPYDSPWSLTEFLNTYFWHAFITSSIIGFIVLVIFVIVPLFFVKKLKKIIIPSKPLEPAHIIAFRELDKLKNEKLWQNNKIKQYHSRITEIIRTYLEHRFDIMAMEQTSHEILTAYSGLGKVDTKLYEALQQQLTLADYVKFAKLNPLPDENDLSMKNAYYFVNETKKILSEVKTESDENVKEEKDV